VMRKEIGAEPLAKVLLFLSMKFMQTKNATQRCWAAFFSWRRERDLFPPQTDLIFNMLYGFYFLLTEILTTFFVQINCKSYSTNIGVMDYISAHKIYRGLDLVL